MAYGKVNCPHCGNEITVRNVEEEQKCFFCKRKLAVEYSRRGKKHYFEVSPIDYVYDKDVKLKGYRDEKK